MCGIVGIHDIEAKRDISRDLLISMRDKLIHRGPDESGTYFQNGIALGHRRLSIIDLASGQQPLSNPDCSVTITYNGEVYNYRELRAVLLSKGYQFETQSDTEVIVHAWSEWGEDCVSKLRGMFAFAIWDSVKSTLFLARDRLGIKPLVYARSSEGYLYFASELKALVGCPGIELGVDDHAVENYFTFGYVPEPSTIYSGIHKLEAGHTLTVSNGKFASPQQYWDMPITEADNSLTFAEAQEELSERLTEAVKIRMVAEVPLGAFLSGGVDSSAIVATMAELQDDPVHACSIGFENSKFDELDYAKLVAGKCGANHHHEVVDNDSDHQLVDSLLQIYDEPYADSSAFPTMRVCAMARSYVKVALSGDGTDEMLAGYRRHAFHMKEERVRGMMHPGLRKFVFGPLGQFYPKADWAPKFLRAKTTFQALSSSSLDAYLGSVSMVSNSTRARMFSSEFKKRLNGYTSAAVFERHALKAQTNDPLQLIQYIDTKTYLIDDILTKVDKASMANSLEVRVPFLDHELVEWMSTLPSDYKLRHGVGKAVLKSSMESRLPRDVLYRQKMGFSVPLSSWIKGALKARVEEALQGERLLDTGIFDRKGLASMLSEHQSGFANHSTALWSLLMFDAFLKNTQAGSSNG